MERFWANWEAKLFRLIGLAAFAYLVYGVIESKPVTESAVIFGIGFFCFFYANISRFKRFKGLGFEAELWEDKQKEAAQLIDSLRDIISIYSAEIITSSVKSGRIGGSGGRWEKILNLVTQIKSGHESAGQHIDLKEVEETVVVYFLFDAARPSVQQFEKGFQELRGQLDKMINSEFGSPVTDPSGYSARRAQLLNPIDELLSKESLASAQDRNLATSTLSKADQLQSGLDPEFGFSLNIEEEHRQKLTDLSKLELDSSFFPTIADIKKYDPK